MKKTFTNTARQFPPVAVRLLARKPYGPPLTNTEIAEASGLSPYEVAAISVCQSWDGIPFGRMIAFTKACDINFDDARSVKRVKAYLRSNPKLGHLMRHRDWETTFKPLLPLAAEAMAKILKG